MMTFSHSFFQGESMREIILLDSNSFNAVFCNDNYVTNSRESGKI